jgi:hypothetical protein
MKKWIAVFIVATVAIAAYGTSEKKTQRSMSPVIHVVVYSYGEQHETHELIPDNPAIPDSIWVVAMRNGELGSVRVFSSRPAEHGELLERFSGQGKNGAAAQGRAGK